MALATYDRRGNVADFRLVVAGTDYSAGIRDRLVSLSLTDKRGGEADELDLVLADHDGGTPLPARGAVARLSLGWLRGTDVPIGLVDKGSFTIDEVGWGGPPDQVTIRGRSADLTAAFRVRREASHRDTTLGAIAREVAKRHGLEPRIAPELASVAVPIVAQHHQSDMALLRRLGRERDAIATVKAGRLILSPIGRLAATSGAAFPALTLDRGEVGTGYRYSLVERSADAGVEARWHDQDAGERKTVRSGKTAKGKTPHRIRRVFHSEAEADAAAKAEAGRRKRAEASMDLQLLLGRPDIYPDRPVTLTGFKREVDATSWLIAEASHTLDSQGLRSKLKLETQ